MVFGMGGVKEGPFTTGLCLKDRGAHHSHLMEYTSYRVSVSISVKGISFGYGLVWLAAFVCALQSIFGCCICGVSRSVDKIVSVYSLFFRCLLFGLF